MRLIGITGGVGAGKSEVLRFIRQHYYCKIYLADEVAHKLQEPGEACYEKLTALLGEEVLSPDGSIDRGKMAARIFLDKDVLFKVNAIVHPAVREYLENAVKETAEDGETELFFIEAALLIENGYNDFVDEMWYIHAGDEIRRKRLRISRGYDDNRISRIMESQLSEDEFRGSSDFILDNSGDLSEVYSLIKKRLEAYTWKE
ncbi:MAG: dephospho-CoA kinase [Lachnospiraceae bacterium]|nr:dephospho-CoA kinase [Lachnospiraceae bacterium]